MVSRKSWMIGVLVGVQTVAMAQKKGADSTFCDPGILGMARTKALSFRYERIPDYGIRSQANSENGASSRNEVDNNYRLEFKAKIPLWIKPNLTIAAGFKYASETYRFEDAGNPYPFYRRLNGKTLKSIGGTLYVIKPFRGNRYLMLRAGADLSGDYHLDDIGNTRFLRFSISPLYGIKRDAYTTYGLGVSYNYIFGRSVISPVFLFNKTFNDRWGVEMLLPASAKLRFHPNPKTYLYASAELNSAHYMVRLVDPIIAQVAAQYLQRSEVRMLLTYEREIYDFLWMSVEAGLRTPFNFSLSQSAATRRDPLVRNQIGSALLLNASIFVVPPRKWMKP